MAWATTATRLLPSAELAVVPGPHNANYGAAGIAALLAGKVGDLAGARVGTILSGGNVDLGVVVPQLPATD